MLFDSTLRRDLARNFGATVVIILTIVLTMMLIRTLGQAAGGQVSPQDVVLLLGYIALGHLPTMLALSLFIAVVATLSRMYRESEMTIWFASGVGLTRFVRPVLRMAWPVLLVIALLALFVWPWQNLRSVELKERFERRSDLSRVAPGQFQTSSDGSRVFFIERDAVDASTGRNVFILTRQAQAESVTSARSGHIEMQGDDRFLILDRGQRNEENLLTGDKTLARFESYRLQAGERVFSEMDNLPAKARTSLDLLLTPTPGFQGELVWRLGLLLGAANMVLLGIGLAATNPRRASNWNLMFALLAFVVYYNIINLSQSWVAGSKISMGAALMLAHGGAFLIALALLWWREYGSCIGLRWRQKGMKTVRRLFYADIVSSVAFVGLAFLALFFFIDFVDELGDVGRNGYSALHAALYCLLLVPGHAYEVSPIAVLIGTIYALARLAQSSEYTILRTGGLGPGRALSLLASLGLVFAVLTYLTGDYLAPLAERQASQLKTSVKGGIKLGRSGAWLKDHATTADGERSYSINVGSAGPVNVLHDIRIFEFDADGRLLRRLAAADAQIVKGRGWTLKNVTVTRWLDAGDASQAPEQRLAELDWPTSLSSAVVAAAVLPVANMSTLELARYIGHLADNEQAAASYQIQFWKRALYPFACLVMVGLALPFAYLQARAGSVSLKVFGGIMLGISFVLLNNVAGHLGLLRDWTPWIVAATPSAIYLLLSLAAFSWLVRYR